MAEIKSTLDLIMEKTRGLTLSEDEKKALRRGELSKRVKGWVQRYLDDAMTLADLRREFNHLSKDDPASARGLLKEELLACLHPEGDNRKILRAMEEVLGLGTEPVRAEIDEFLGKVIAGRMARMKGLEESLARQGISGSAVLPNVALDAGWEAFYRERLEEFRRRAGGATGS